MKRIVSYILGAGLLVTACNPMEDIYDELDQHKTPFVQQLDYTLTAADYELFDSEVADNYFFSEEEPAADYIPSLLQELFPALDEGSAIRVTYDFNRGGLEYLDYLTKSISYELSNDDYDSMGTETGKPGKYNNFDSGIPPGDYLPDFFSTKFPAAKSGDIVFVTYKFYSGGVSNRSEYYGFNGSVWAPVQVDLPEGVSNYELTTDDYDAMGEDNGKPGRYDNFDSNMNPNDYLPTFLSIHLPFALEGEKVAVVYKYYASGKTTKRAIEYTKTDGKWIAYNPIMTQTDQFINTSESGWVFDPTVMFTMSKEDYQIIVDWVKSNKGSEFIDSYGTQEFWFSAGSYYGNYDVRDKWNTEAFSTWQEAVQTSIGDVLLPAKFPDAVSQVSGIDVMYKVTIAVYSGVNEQFTWSFQCTKSGPNPEFEFVE
ncbi:MAG: hypothetical protein WCY58_08385 [Mariniphaga sp.]|nr:hypothetical protein [Mariniphaga sp.]MDD4424819.1 hypothetical protein [Mariniphaga sp.]